jgi:hypothetical protein
MYDILGQHRTGATRHCSRVAAHRHTRCACAGVTSNESNPRRIVLREDVALPELTSDQMVVPYPDALLASLAQQCDQGRTQACTHRS